MFNLLLQLLEVTDSKTFEIGRMKDPDFLTFSQIKIIFDENPSLYRFIPNVKHLKYIPKRFYMTVINIFIIGPVS